MIDCRYCIHDEMCSLLCKYDGCQYFKDKREWFELPYKSRLDKERARKLLEEYEAQRTRKCEECGVEFIAATPKQRFCGQKCWRINNCRVKKEAAALREAKKRAQREAEKERRQQEAAEEARRIKEARQLNGLFAMDGKSIPHIGREARAFGLDYGEYTGYIRCGTIENVLTAKGITNWENTLREIAREFDG